MHPSLVLLGILQTAPLVQPTPAVCPDVQRLELSLEHGTAPEVCISPGLLTGFVFDSRVVVDVEAEIRFAGVTRGNTSVTLMPPEDAMEGERFRLTAYFPDGVKVTTVLLVHRGMATRQVEVYRDKRTRESFLHEVAQEQARNQRLQEENESLRRQLEQLRAECGDPRELRRLLASRVMGEAGIPAQQLSPRIFRHREGAFTLAHGASFRLVGRVAIAVWLKNGSTEPWSTSKATLEDARGTELTGITLWLEGGSIPPGESRLLVVEADTKDGAPQGELTLVLREDGPRSITIPGVALPH